MHAAVFPFIFQSPLHSANCVEAFQRRANQPAGLEPPPKAATIALGAALKLHHLWLFVPPTSNWPNSIAAYKLKDGGKADRPDPARLPVPGSYWDAGDEAKHEAEQTGASPEYLSDISGAGNPTTLTVCLL